MAKSPKAAMEGKPIFAEAGALATGTAGPRSLPFTFAVNKVVSFAVEPSQATAEAPFINVVTAARPTGDRSSITIGALKARPES